MENLNVEYLLDKKHSVVIAEKKVRYVRVTITAEFDLARIKPAFLVTRQMRILLRTEDLEAAVELYNNTPAEYGD